MCFLDGKEINHLLFFKPLEYQRIVVCMVSTVNLNSTILFNEDLIEEICLSTGQAATCCSFGISVNIFCHSIQSEGLSTFITLIIRTFNCLSS